MSQQRVVKKLVFGKGRLLVIDEKKLIHSPNTVISKRYVKYLETNEDIEIKEISDLVFLARAKNINLINFISTGIDKFSKFISSGWRLGMIIYDREPFSNPKSKYFIDLRDFSPKIIDNNLQFITLNKENSKAIIAKYKMKFEDLSYKKEVLSIFDTDIE